MALTDPPENPLLRAILGPQRLTNTIRGVGVTAPPVDVNYQRNLTALTNKYTALADTLAQVPEPIRNSLINYDATRVARGASPLTQRQTALALQTALTGQPATPEPDRNPLSILSNIRNDLGTILKSLPRLPFAAVNEVRDIANFGQHMAEARQAGQNPLSALLQAPGVRMIPGTYVAGNLLDGRRGIQELATHPLLAALDVLPAASQAAAGTRVGRLAAEAAETAGRRPRPISALLTNRVVDTVDGAQLQRNTLGQAVDVFRNETRLGQALDAFGGRRSRDVARARGQLEQRYRSLLLGKGVPTDTVETFLPRVKAIFERYSDEYPMFRQDASVSGPEWDAQRAQFFEDIQRDPSKYNPALVNEIRDLNYDMAKYQESLGLLRQFDGEWFDVQTANRLQRGQQRLAYSRRMFELRNEYLNPSGQVTIDRLRSIADEIAGTTDRRQRATLGRAFEQVLDAYRVDIKPVRTARADIELGRGDITAWRETVDKVLAEADLTPRRSLSEVVAILRSHKADRQATLLEAAVQYGKRNEVTKRLKNLYSRKPPTFPEELFPQLREDIRSLSRRIDFDEQIGRQFTEKRVGQRERAFQRMLGTTPPARFQELISDRVQAEAPARLRARAEEVLARPLQPEEAAQVVGAVQRRLWADVPGVSAEEAAQIVRQVEREVAATWRELRAAGHDPVFVHKVSPARANQALAGNIGPVPVTQSATKERALDLSPSVRDVQLALTHQAGEMLQKRYSEMFVEQVIDSVGKTEAQLRQELADAVNWRMSLDPSLDFEGHLQQMIRRGWEKFNPDEAGHSWGGVRLDKYRQEDWYIPKAVADNLHRYAKPPSILSSLTDPLTKAFRYNVIGLSASVIVNNFFSNAVAMMAESGPRPFKHWNAAREWLRNPELIPNEQLKAMILAEVPHMESLSRDAWLQSRVGQRFMTGFNAGKAFQESVFTRTAGSMKDKLDAVVRKSLEAQRWGDNVYRAMQYMDEVERGVLKGKTRAEAENAALELVRRTFVDYTSFTPIERSAMRTIVPFYSYMGHAARFIARYPLDHPLRASVAAQLAEAERERLGALPGSFLSMVPLPFGFGDMDSDGKRNMLALRPFDPFGDISDLLSVAGWMSAMNPLIQTALQQVGVVRGEAELYPTLRYDPETGRMRAVHGNMLTDLFHNTMPRAGLITSLLGLNPAHNELRSRDPDAANRQLVSMAGLPRVWRQVDVPREMTQAEISRDRAATDVRNEALRTGNWREALRYPTLRPLFDAVRQLPPETIQSMTPDEQQAIADQLRTLIGA